MTEIQITPEKKGWVGKRRSYDRVTPCSTADSQTYGKPMKESTEDLDTVATKLVRNAVHQAKREFVAENRRGDTSNQAAGRAKVTVNCSEWQQSNLINELQKTVNRQRREHADLLQRVVALEKNERAAKKTVTLLWQFMVLFLAHWLVSTFFH